MVLEKANIEYLSLTCQCNCVRDKDELKVCKPCHTHPAHILSSVNEVHAYTCTCMYSLSIYYVCVFRRFAYVHQ